MVENLVVHAIQNPSETAFESRYLTYPSEHERNTAYTMIKSGNSVISPEDAEDMIRVTLIIEVREEGD